MSKGRRDSDQIERCTKDKFDGGCYSNEVVTKAIAEEPLTFSERLLRHHLDTIHEFTNQNSVVMDLCCATCTHLFAMADEISKGVGVDFSEQYLEEANRQRLQRNIDNIDLVLASARKLPFKEAHFDLVYSLSSLHVIPRVVEVIDEVARVLKSGGIFLGDFGNLYSLNYFVCKGYPEIAEPCFLPSGQLREHLQNANFRIIRHRCFQLLPLWGQRPRWLKPLLWPGWEKLVRRQVRGKMLDEWISSMPGLRRLAFRQVFLCEKL